MTMPTNRDDIDLVSWYRIENKEPEILDVYIDDEIGLWGISAAQFNRDYVVALQGKNKVNFHINSVGGDVVDGLSIYTTIKNAKAKTTTYIESIAASTASFIALASDKVFIENHAMIFIHNAWMMVAGDAEDLRKAAGDVEKMQDQIVKIYVEKTKQPENKIRQMMDDETLITAEDAVSLGFADGIVGSKDKAPKEKIEDKYLPIFINRIKENRTPATKRQIEHVLRNYANLSKKEARQILSGVSDSKKIEVDNQNQDELLTILNNLFS